MILFPSSILVLLCTYSPISLVSARSSSSGAYTISNDVTAFIPSCAQPCFYSFVQANFPISLCSSTPSLHCLCSSNSTSGYTIGEGALQCIVSEDSLGFCQGVNATAAVVRDAFNMCSGEANALPNTHSTITATLEVQTSDPSIVLVVPTPTSRISSGSTTPIVSASITSNSAQTTVSSGGSLTLSITSSPTAEGQATESPIITTKLTTPQIVGIAVGGGAVVVLVIGGIVFFVCLRRKKFLDDDSYFGNFEEDHGNSMEAMFAGPTEKKLGALGPGGTNNGVAAKVAPPIPPPPLLSHPNMFSRRSIRTEEIGVAISPEMGRETDGEFEGRHPSRLLPDKPAWPQSNNAATRQALSRPGHSHLPAASHSQGYSSRDDRPDSEATQFEVDVVSPIEFSRDPESLAYGGRGPQLPQNWYQEYLPRSRTAPIQLEPRPLEIRKTQSHQSFSQPLKPRSTTSSVYTGRVSLAPSELDDTPSDWYPPQSYLPFNPYEVKRHDSLGSPSPTRQRAKVDVRLTELRTVDLSPVAESPTNKSPVGRSPVQYPKIKSRLSDQMMKEVAAPEQQLYEQKQRKREAREDISQRAVSNKVRNVPMTESTTRRREAPRSNDAQPPLAARRNKQKPALKLDGEFQRQRQVWRVVSEEDAMKSPMMSTTLSPQKIGDGLFLGVQKHY